MKYKDMATEMTEQEIQTALYIILPEAKFRRFRRENDYIRVWYSLPNDKEDTVHKLDLLPDDVYFVDDTSEHKEKPLIDGDILYRYSQLMIAKGYSLIWKGNPYIL